MGDRPVMEAPVAPCFVRAPTDNDAGGSGGAAHAARWLQMGLDRLCVTDAAISITERRSDLVVIQVSCCALSERDCAN